MYGKLGILETDGEQVQCHICGKWYLSLGHHLHLAHGTNPDEYRSDFGLNRTQSLMAPVCREKFRKIHADHLKKHNKNPEQRLKLYVETHGNIGASRKKRIQHKLERSQMFRKSDWYAKLVKMGTEGTHPFQSEDHKDKLRQAFLDGIHPLQKPEIKAKAAAANRRPERRAAVSIRQKQAFASGISPLQRPEVIEKRISAVKKEKRKNA